MMITMKAHEHERELYIKIVDDDILEPDEQFHVCLLDEKNRTRMQGWDTCTTITILDDARPGVIGFEDTVHEANV